MRTRMRRKGQTQASAAHHGNLEAVKYPLCLPEFRKPRPQGVGNINHSHRRPRHRQVPHTYRHQVTHENLHQTHEQQQQFEAPPTD